MEVLLLEYMVDLTAYVEKHEFCFDAVVDHQVTNDEDKSVVLWSIHDNTSTLATDSDADGKSPKATDDKPPTKSPKFLARGVFQGHDDTVDDVQFCPSSAEEFCSVGDDSCLILWDASTGLYDYLQVEKAHNADLHCVDWNQIDNNLILTGSADNTVRLFDRQNLTSIGVGSPVHIFANHNAAVLCVQVLTFWSLFFLLFFTLFSLYHIIQLHLYKINGVYPTMARDKVVDFHWNTHDPWTIVSVSDDDGSIDGGGTLQSKDSCNKRKLGFE
ncbi:WD-40 repeat-containing protein MSI4-like [Bidens hawaiensis]|uniref:WD-40 repeat-containing protein MSI4-like n=1 Tax=Bidens hawaiensis TaxID=980011 RepID=UPI00404B4B45